MKSGECLLPFSLEYFVFPFAIDEYKYKIQRTVTLPVTLFGCETWSFTLRIQKEVVKEDIWG